MPTLRTALLHLVRALALRCPHCGGRGLFRSWLRMRETCPTCALALDRGERGYQVGSYMLNIIAAELIFLALFLGVLAATWPEPPWALLQYGGAAMMVLAPVLLYPFTKTVFLAMDLMVRPAGTAIQPEVGGGAERPTAGRQGGKATAGAAAFLGLCLVPSLGAQELPALRPINPIISSRSALGFTPVVPRGSGWSFGITMDHGNVIEAQERPPERIVIDGELTRLDLALSRELGPRWFVAARVPIEAADGGFLDGFVDWWHGLFGFDEVVREERPSNVYEYSLGLPDSSLIVRDAGQPGLGDIHLMAGFRHTPGWQTAVTVALPTSTRPVGFQLGTVAVAATTTWRSRLKWDRLTYEGSLGLGYTPSEGDLADRQRRWFAQASSGLRWRALGLQSVYANLYYHSGAYHDTELSMLSASDLSLDFGFLLKPGAGGPEILAGLTEDLYVFGPAVDMVFRLGIRW
ncbi:MAG TPA: DUF3187 family protein [Gemmatimonadales bacterium]